VQTAELEALALQVRADILKMTAAAGSGHPGGSLSAADVMCALYLGGVLRHDPQDPTWPGRDRFILSKAHVAPVLYAVMARAGYLPLDELASLRRLDSRLQGHPDRLKLPGVEVSGGSLGQGLSIAAGLAYALTVDHRRASGDKDGASLQRVFALLGDGECQEGQVWEAAMFAAHKRLENLVPVIDQNGLQIDGPTSEVMSLGSIAGKFEQFGWLVREVDGHDMAALLEVLQAARADERPVPKAIVAHTVKGKGVSFMENEAGWHGKAPNADQLALALAELSGEER